jgi:hypothetical protein
MFPAEKPSQIREKSRDEFNQLGYQSNRWLVQRFITSGAGLNNCFGSGNFLYVCLAALVEIHLSSAPRYVPYIDGNGIGSHVCYEYRGVRSDLFQPISPGIAWTRLRRELDEQRTTLRWIGRFFRKHFDDEHKDLQAAFEDIKERFTLRVQDLEQSESHLRDHLAAEGINKSYHMAEMSIRESKRVMLRMLRFQTRSVHHADTSEVTALAFVFLPFSLATSVYGMVCRPQDLAVNVFFR